MAGGATTNYESYDNATTGYTDYNVMDGECLFASADSSATPEDSMMYGFASVEDWCDDHDYYSCENDALDACMWVAAATDTTADMNYTMNATGGP